MLLFTVRIISMAEAWSPGYRVHLCSYITVQWLGPLDGSRTPSPRPILSTGAWCSELFRSFQCCDNWEGRKMKINDFYWHLFAFFPPERKAGNQSCVCLCVDGASWLAAKVHLQGSHNGDVQQIERDCKYCWCSTSSFPRPPPRFPSCTHMFNCIHTLPTWAGR